MPGSTPMVLKADPHRGGAAGHARTHDPGPQHHDARCWSYAWACYARPEIFPVLVAAVASGKARCLSPPWWSSN